MELTSRSTSTAHRRIGSTKTSFMTVAREPHNFSGTTDPALSECRTTTCSLHPLCPTSTRNLPCGGRTASTPTRSCRTLNLSTTRPTISPSYLHHLHSYL